MGRCQRRSLIGPEEPHVALNSCVVISLTSVVVSACISVATSVRAPGRLDLQSRVRDLEIGCQRAGHFPTQLVLVGAFRHDDMSGQRHLSGTERPDMEVVETLDVAQTRQGVAN